MLVRPARESDLPVLREVVERAYGVYVERIGRRPAPMDVDYARELSEGHISVAEVAGAVVGLIVLIPGGDHLQIETVAVDPERQGLGIGRFLLAFAETVAAERGIPELRLYTNVAMTENLLLYPRLGYREVDRRTESGFDRVFFSKSIELPKA